MDDTATQASSTRIVCAMAITSNCEGNSVPALENVKFTQVGLKMYRVHVPVKSIVLR